MNTSQRKNFSLTELAEDTEKCFLHFNLVLRFVFLCDLCGLKRPKEAGERSESNRLKHPSALGDINIIKGHCTKASGGYFQIMTACVQCYPDKR